MIERVSQRKNLFVCQLYNGPLCVAKATSIISKSQAIRNAYNNLRKDTAKGDGRFIHQTKILISDTKMTRQVMADTIESLKELEKDCGHITLDLEDEVGNIGHACIFRGADGKLYARKGTPDPRCLYNSLKRNLRVRVLKLCDAKF